MAVNSLINRTVSSFEQQKQFIGNASHELQTPLAIMLTKLEMLLDNGDLSVEQAPQVASVLAIVERMIKLNKSLLLLTKIENNQIFNNQKININNVLTQTLEDLDATASYKQVHITTTISDSLEVFIDPTLARIIVSNLLRNAIFHHHRQGTVLISIQNGCLSISNTGIKSLLNTSLIYSRFYKSNHSNEGTGLGLAIVNAIVSLCNMKLLYNYHAESHTFSVDFN